MTAPQESALEFPCSFPIKTMGLAQHDIESLIRNIVQRHTPDLDATAVTARASSGGKYVSVTVTITATSREQLDAIYRDLSACEQILVAL